MHIRFLIYCRSTAGIFFEDMENTYKSTDMALLGIFYESIEELPL